MNELTTAWADWKAIKAPHILLGDEPILASERSRTFTANDYTEWKDVYSQPDFGKPGDTKLQLGIIPHPFCGDIKNAEIYILMLNPGYGPHDYFAELEVLSYKEAALKNLRQEFEHRSYPFYLLNPEFAWTGGYAWWHKKLAFTIDEISKKNETDYANARKCLSQKIASIELVPYHSTSFYDPIGWAKKLESAKLARKFVNEYVVPKVQRNEAILIATRKVKEWNLPEHNNIIVYSSSEARSAHLSPASRGGRAIIERLAEVNKGTIL